MLFCVVRRLISPTSTIRWALFLLSVVTVIYFVVFTLWETPASLKHTFLHADSAHSHKRSSRLGSQLSAFVDSFVPEGNSLWIEGRSIQVMSAIHDLHHHNVSETRIVLLSFLQHSSEREFVCCFHTSANSDDFVEVPANLDFIDLRFIVNIQNAAFECILKPSHVNSVKPFKFVSFAPRTCNEDLSHSLRIVYPLRRTWEFAVCTKVAYARLEPARLVEWFEYMREIGASKVVTFHNNLHPDSKRVFDYYAETGFLELIEYRPQTKRNGTRVLYTDKNSQTHQARHDKTLVVRDCQYRLGGYDFVITIDFDELPVPMRPYGSLNWIFQNLLRNHTDGAAFRMDPILLPPEWQHPVRDLYHWQFSTGTYITPYCIKWVYIPSRTWLAATHENVPKEGYHTYVIPQDVLHFLHFRSCKAIWHEVPCQNLTQTVQNESTLKRFEGGVLQNLRKLPLEDLISNKDYIKFVHVDSRGASDTKRWDGDLLANILLTKH